MTQFSKTENQLTAGFDLGDNYSYLYVIDTATGEMIEETRLPTNPEKFERYFADREAMHVAVETGKHSPWVSRVLAGCGHKVLVANARKLSFIYRNERNSSCRSYVSCSSREKRSTTFPRTSPVSTVLA